MEFLFSIFQLRIIIISCSFPASFSSRTCLILCVLSILYAPFSHGDEYEPSPTLAARELYPNLSLNTELYEILPDVTTDGFLTRTIIKTDFGEFEAVGPGMLNIRLNEVEALAKLKDLASSDEFQTGAQDSVKDKSEGIKQLVENPKETAQGIGEGVGRFFKRVGRAAKTGYQTAGDILDEKTPGVIVEEGPGVKLPGAQTTRTEPDTKNKYTKVAGVAGKVGLNILGFDDARRSLAKRLVIDPYTTNQVLDQQLDKVTQSIFAGDMAINIVTTLIPGGRLVTATTVATDWVWDIPPGDLYVKIEQILLATGVSKVHVDNFLRNPWYPLSSKALLAESLDSLDNVLGRDGIFPLVLTVTSYDQARFVTNSLRMAAKYHKTVRPIKELAVHGTLVATDADGTLVVTAPVDYMSWVKPLDNFSSQELFMDGEMVIYLPGVMSGTAREILETRGWKVNENSNLLDIPAG